jgi:ribosomal protein S18 acetylase RimI-like enzyme
MVKSTTTGQLPKVAECHIACFPGSLSTKLGKAYVQKTLEWFLVNPNRFLYHIESGDKVAGYCGGFAPIKHGDGSSSGMLQFAFNEAVKGLLRNPFLLFHPEVRQQYPFIWLNIKRKITGKNLVIGAPPANPAPMTHVGLVVIGVHPEFRGTGIAQQLIEEFEVRAKGYQRNELVLSVKRDNGRAINAYKKSGWNIKKDDKKTYVMHKFI